MQSFNVRCFILGIGLTVGGHGWALQQLDETALASQTGQDGISVKVASTIGQINFNSLSLIDKDGFAGRSAGALTYAPNSVDSGVSFYQGGSGSYTLFNGASPLFVLNTDADAGNSNQAFLNLNVAFNSQLSRINLSPFAIGLTTVAADGSSLQSTRKDLIRTGGNGIDILFNTANPLGLNIQLGNQPQGAMALFKGSLQGIQASGLQIMSYTAGTTDSSRTIRFDANIKPNAASTNGIRLDGTYASVKANGLEVGNAGTVDKFDVGLSNISFGQVGNTAAGTFNSLKNGSVGALGANGMAITGLKTTVRGL